MATTLKSRTQARQIVDQRLIKALAHPLRAQLLSMFNERVASPTELAKELGEGLSQVSYHVKVLREYECIELVKTEPRRGAVEHFYRGTARVFFKDDAWKQLPDVVKTGISTNTVQSIVNDAVEALAAETFDAREDRHLSWTPVVLDEEGWGDITTLLAETLERVLDIQAESAGRLAEAREEGVPATVAIMSFETPSPEQKQKGIRTKS